MRGNKYNQMKISVVKDIDKQIFRGLAIPY